MPKGLQRATAFTMQGPKLEIELHTTSLTGRPILTCNDRSFSGDQIHVAEHAIGTLYSVVLDAEPDQQMLTLTLIVPPIYVSMDNPSEARFLAIYTTSYTTIAGPPPGQAHEYQECELRGVARLLVY